MVSPGDYVLIVPQSSTWIAWIEASYSDAHEKFVVVDVSPSDDGPKAVLRKPTDPDGMTLRAASVDDLQVVDGP
jgi:hypothetical protein